MAATALATIYPPFGGQPLLPGARYTAAQAPFRPAAPQEPAKATAPAVAAITAAPPATLSMSAPASPLTPTAITPAPPPVRAAPPGVKPDAPAFGSIVSGVVPFAGEMVPLPAGEWVTVAVIGGRTSAGKLTTSAMLAQLVADRTTSIIMLNAVGLPNQPGAGYPRVVSCQETRNIYSRVFVAVDGGEQACWSIDAAKIDWSGPGDRLRASGVAELQQRGATLPEITLRARFVRADSSRVLLIELCQAVDTPSDGPGGWDWSHIMATPQRLARMTRLRDWAARWWPLIDRGFASRLNNADVTSDLARVPL